MVNIDVYDPHKQKLFRVFNNFECKEILRPKSMRTAVLENVTIQISYETPQLLMFDKPRHMCQFPKCASMVYQLAFC